MWDKAREVVGGPECPDPITDSSASEEDEDVSLPISRKRKFVAKQVHI